jgi:hypothetical protein
MVWWGGDVGCGVQDGDRQEAACVSSRSRRYSTHSQPASQPAKPTGWRREGWWFVCGDGSGFAPVRTRRHTRTSRAFNSPGVYNHRPHHRQHIGTQGGVGAQRVSGQLTADVRARAAPTCVAVAATPQHGAVSDLSAGAGMQQPQMHACCCMLACTHAREVADTKSHTHERPF